MPQNRATGLILVADPMCSWCYAFGPQLDRIIEETRLPVRVVLGGLFVGARSIELDDRLRAYLRETWPRVAQSSGRPVDESPLGWTNWTYDTEPACRAVVVARRLRPVDTMIFFDRLQAAFYAEAVDITDREALVELAVEAGFDRAEFAELLRDEATIAETRSDFSEAAAMGATGFPTLFLETEAERIVVAAGHSPATRVIRTISALTP